MSQTVSELVGKAEQLCDLGRPAAALALLASVADDEPEVWQVRARALYNQGDHEAARDAARRAVAADPEDPDGHILLSQAHRAMNNHDSAVVAAATARRLAPHAATCHRLLAEALLDLDPDRIPFPGGRDARGEAALAAHRAVELAPHDARCWVALATVHSHYGAWEERDRATARALEIAPDDATIHNNLARLQQMANGFAAAASGFARAAAMAPDGVAAGNLEMTVRQAVELPILNVASTVLRFAWPIGIVLTHLPPGGRVAGWAIFGSFFAIAPWFQIGDFFVDLPAEARRPAVRAIRRNRWLALRFVLLALAAVLLPAAIIPSPASPALLVVGLACYAAAITAIVVSAKRAGSPVRVSWRWRPFWFRRHD